MVSSKRAFWQAFIFTLVIFGLGLMIGFFFEVSRAHSAENVVSGAEISLLDEQLRNRATVELNLSCDAAVESMFEFADSIYTDAATLEEQDASTHFSGRFAALHRRYDLLRTMLWVESISLKERCGDSFHTVVYLYTYKPAGVEAQAQQSFYSRMLLDLKYAHPGKLLLIPIAVNTDLGSVDLILKKYDVKSTPRIIVDERDSLGSIKTLEELERIVFQSNN